MSSRRMLVAALLVMGIVPATANATPTVTATGDAGTPVALNPSAPTGIRQMDVSVTVAVPRTDAPFFPGAGRRRRARDAAERLLRPERHRQPPGLARLRRERHVHRRRDLRER